MGGLVFSRLQPHGYLRGLLEELTSILWLHGHGWHYRRILLESHVGPLLGVREQRPYLQRLPLRIPTRRRRLIVNLSASSTLRLSNGPRKIRLTPTPPAERK